MAKPTILVNLKRCTGCWTCSFSCKVAHGLGVEEFWQYVRTNGGTCIDEPLGEYPNCRMDWTPIYTKKCIMCADITKDGELPYCVRNCPCGALTYGDLDDPESEVSLRKAQLEDRGFKIYTPPAYEEIRKGVLYADRL